MFVYPIHIFYFLQFSGKSKKFQGLFKELVLLEQTGMLLRHRVPAEQGDGTLLWQCQCKVKHVECKNLGGWCGISTWVTAQLGCWWHLLLVLLPRWLRVDVWKGTFWSASANLTHCYSVKIPSPWVCD